MNGKLLVVLAHPDDETFIIGGTLARYARLGWAITLVCATRGEMGSRVGVPAYATRETLPVVREVELRAACRALGITDLRFLGLRDKTVDYYEPGALAARIAGIMRMVKPDVVLTFHEATGGHSDHCAVGRAARLAFEAAGGNASLYFVVGGWMPVDEQLRRSGFGEDRVTRIAIEGEDAAAKVEAYRAHRTQSQRMTWLWEDREAAIVRKTGVELLLQGSGPARQGETLLSLAAAHPVEEDQVGGGRSSAHLAEHEGDLPAVICPMIDQVL